jgi:hypothetical protein
MHVILSALLAAISILTAACSTLPAPHALPSSAVSVEGDTITCDGQPFAEVRYYFTSEGSSGQLHRGLALYYFRENRLVWIFPAEGLERAVADGYFTPRSKAAARLHWVFDVSVAPDGRTVRYKKTGSLWNSSHEFLVEEGRHRQNKRLQAP